MQDRGHCGGEAMTEYPAFAVAPGQSIRIRPVTAADIPQVVALDQRTTGVAKADYWNETFTRWSNRGGRFFLVADAGGRLLGFITGEVRAWEFGSPPCGWIFAIQVDTEVRLRNIGSRLYQAICQRFRESGVTKVRTMLARDNTLIMSFFRSQGMMAGPYIELETDLD